MQKRTAYLLAGMGLFLLALVAVLTVLHLSSLTQVPEGAVQVEFGGETAFVRPADLSLSAISGTVVNGKGDEIAVEGRGLPLLQVLQAAGVTDYSAVRAVADDSYHAEYTAAELTEEGRVVLLAEEDSFRIVAFGDKDSRRNVSGVIRLVVS